jgi:hypothetical protein
MSLSTTLHARCFRTDCDESHAVTICEQHSPFEGHTYVHATTYAPATYADRGNTLTHRLRVKRLIAPAFPLYERAPNPTPEPQWFKIDLLAPDGRWIEEQQTCRAEDFTKAVLFLFGFKEECQPPAPEATDGGYAH